jgi:hypothetical protein
MEWDWGHHLFYYEVARKSILEFHQIPLWNPYHCGGNVMLANPQSVFLSPSFIFVLLFNTVRGIKISILAHAFLGMFGFFLLSKQLKIKGISSYLPSIIFMLSGTYPVHIMVGHSTWQAMAWLPYVFLFYLRSMTEKKYIFLSAIFLVFIFFQGHGYLFLFTVLFLFLYSIFKAIQLRKMRLMLVTIFLLLVVFLLGGIKLIPTIEFMKDYPRMVQRFIYPYSFEIFYNFLLNQQLTKNLESILKNAEYYTFLKNVEYYIYIGVCSFLLSLFGMFVNFKREWPLIVTGLIFLTISFGFWTNILRVLPFFQTARVLSRYIVIFIFTISIFAGFGLSKLEEHRYGTLISLIIISFITIDLLLANSSLFYHAFRERPPQINRTSFFYQVTTSKKYENLYFSLLENVGQINCYEEFPISRENAIPKYVDGKMNAEYRGEAFLLYGGNASIVFFSPNKVKIKVNTQKENILILNQNFYKG